MGASLVPISTHRPAGVLVRSRLLASLLATTATIGAVVGFSAPSGAGAVPLRYVAMGDSYSAASGVLPPDPSAFFGCARSTKNFAHDIAATVISQLTDVTCGAAETKDYFTSQYPGVAPQLDALRKDTQLVTMTIGGNDSGVFIDAIVECGQQGVTSLGKGSPCKDKYGSSFETTVKTKTYPSLVK